jgi:hypothetical protein
MNHDSKTERRVHKVYVTRNTEYHVRKGICVAVRDRKSGCWIPSHAAIQKRIEGSLRFHREGGYAPHFGEPAVGDAIYFNDGDRDLITSKLERIERPDRATVALYPTE